MLNFFMDFVIGEIDEIKNDIKLFDPRNHLETTLNKIRQALIARQLSAVAVRESLLEQSKVCEPGESSKSRVLVQLTTIRKWCHCRRKKSSSGVTIPTLLESFIRWKKMSTSSEYAIWLSARIPTKFVDFHILAIRFFPLPTKDLWRHGMCKKSNGFSIKHNKGTGYAFFTLLFGWNESRFDTT